MSSRKELLELIENATLGLDAANRWVRSVEEDLAEVRLLLPSDTEVADNLLGSLASTKVLTSLKCPHDTFGTTWLAREVEPELELRQSIELTKQDLRFALATAGVIRRNLRRLRKKLRKLDE